MQGHHDALYASPGHRAAIFDENQTDIGISEQNGSFRGRNTSMLTEVFAAQAGNRYVTGVAYTDSDNDDFYSIGEGLSGVTFQTTGSSTNSAAAGGYAIDADTGMTAVSIVRDGTTISQVSIDTSAGNAKLDLIADGDGGYALAVSTTTTLVSGVDDVQLLGVGHQNLIGNDGDNRMEGNDGKNRLFGNDGDDDLFGGNGRDKMFGGAGDDYLSGGRGNDNLFGRAGNDVMIGSGGRDKLWGNDGDDVLKGGAARDKLFGGGGDDILRGHSGRDVIKGGQGNDMLFGGAGGDKFIFTSGQDTIRDFKDDVDTIVVNRAVINGSGSTIDDLLDRGEIIGGNAVFDLDGSHQLTIRGVTDLEDLRDDLVIG